MDLVEGLQVGQRQVVAYSLLSPLPGQTELTNRKRLKNSAQPLLNQRCAVCDCSTANFNGFEGRVLEAARTADSSRFTTQNIYVPPIDVSVNECLSSHAHHVQINIPTHITH